MRLFFVLLIALLCTACREKNDMAPLRFHNTIMEISYTIQVGASGAPLENQRIQEIIDATFDEVNQRYNKWNPDSELSQLNALSAGQKLPLSPELYAFFLRIDPLVHLSGGRFDPTVEPAQALWKSYLEQGVRPSAEDVAALRSCVGWNNVHFENGIFYKDHSRTRLDFGGVAKGYCIDLLVERLMAEGYPNVYVEWGGEIRTAGIHPSGRPWQVYISNLDDANPSHALAYIPLKGALATSGDYFQYWTVMDEQRDKQTYCHIIDPRTCTPLKIMPGTVASASLLADDCLTADALAKVLMLFDSVDEAKAWAQEQDLVYWIATRNKPLSP